MNGWPGTAGYPDLTALAAADELCQTDSSSPLSPCHRNDLHGEEARTSALRRHSTAASQAESVTGATAGELREWTKAIGRGDEAAFVRFYDLYSLRLYRYLLVLARGNEGEARDVLQTVVVKLAKGFKTFDEERRLWGWLSSIARNSYVDLCRAQRRDQRFVPLEAHHPAITEGLDGRHQLSESLQHALDQLAMEDQELIRAAYVDKRPLQELADVSGQTYKAVESRLARLRRKLKTKLLNHLRHEECS